MDPVLLLIPSTENWVNRRKYLAMCIDLVTEEGFIPLTPALYEKTSVNQDKFIQSSLKYVSIVYLFVNFGIDAPMFRVIDESSFKAEIRYRRIAETKIDQLYSDPLSILQEVCSITGYTKEQLQSKTRKREIVDLRKVYFRRCREITKATLEKIGELVNRDHATVMYGINEAMSTAEIIKLYDKVFNCFNEAPIDVETEKEVEHPVLPYRLLDKREEQLPDGKIFMQSLVNKSIYDPYKSYTPNR
jgi:hypothetical protein